MTWRTEWSKSLPQNRLQKKEWRDFWDNNKRTNIHIIGVPEGEERENWPKKISEEILGENFLNIGKETVKPRQHTESKAG